MRLLKTKTAKLRAKQTRNREWARRNDVRVGERNKKWRAQNRPTMREYGRIYYERNRDELLFRGRLATLLNAVVRAHLKKTHPNG